MQRRIGIVMGVFVLGLGVSTSAFADFCISADNGVNYRLQVGTATPAVGTPVVVTGVRTVLTFKTPVFGTLIATATDTLIGLQEVYDFGSGGPHNVLGLLSVVACPASEEAAAAVPGAEDPNGRN